MKKYYKCPLQAAYMNKEFGVEYQYGGLPYTKQGGEYGCLFVSYSAESEEVKEKFVKAEKINIHPDSYHIFDTQLHDIVEWDGIMFGTVIGENKEEDIIGVQHGVNDDGGCDVYTLELDEVKIVQRDDKPFFTPLEDIA